MSKIEEISGVDEAPKSSKMSSTSPYMGDVSFEALMDKISQREELKVQDFSKDFNVTKNLEPSPVEVTQTEEVKVPSIVENPSDIAHNVIRKTENSNTRIEEIKTTLKGLNDGDIAQPYRHSLRNKLTHIDDKLQIALSIAGSESKQSPRVSLINPVANFLNSLSHAQTQMGQLGEHLAAMGSRKETLGVADMLAIQIKVQQVQQQLEFFSATLNQAMQGFKQVIQTQV